jgi:hypothetical protein
MASARWRLGSVKFEIFAAPPEIICFAEPRCGTASGPGPWVGPMHGFITKFADGVFYPEEIEILTAAFDDAWARIQASRAPFSREDYVVAAREILAKHIIMAAKRGGRNRRQLTEDALLHLSQQKLSGKPPA